jgi:site-specific DNA-methyltransferase (adenine-specific)
MEKYEVIYADPPWRFGDKQLVPKARKEDGSYDWTSRTLEEFHYPTMSDNELREYFRTQVSVQAEDDAVMVMWTTDAHIPLAIELGTLAGFTYRTVAFIWNKKTVTGKQVCFMGKWTMKGSEIALLFTRGKPYKLLKARNVRQLVEAERREHSRKPDEVRERIETMFPDATKLELFARTSAPGWSVEGNETTKF